MRVSSSSSLMLAWIAMLLLLLPYTVTRVLCTATGSTAGEIDKDSSTGTNTYSTFVDSSTMGTLTSSSTVRVAPPSSTGSSTSTATSMTYSSSAIYGDSSTGVDTASELMAQNVTAALQVTFLSSYPYVLFSSDPERFVANFKQDLYRSCDIPVNRILQVLVMQLATTQSLTRSVYLAARTSKAATTNTMSVSFLIWPAASAEDISSEDLLAVVQQQVNTTNSLLYQGAVTSYVTSSSSKLVSACSDGTYQSPCSTNGSPVETSITTSSSSSLPTWIIAVIAVIVALIVIAAVAGILTRIRSSSKDAPPPLKKEPSMSSSGKRRQTVTASTVAGDAGFLGVPHTAPLVISTHSAESAADVLQSKAAAIEDVDLTNVVGLTRSARLPIHTVEDASAVAVVTIQSSVRDFAHDASVSESSAEVPRADHESEGSNSSSTFTAVKIHL